MKDITFVRGTAWKTKNAEKIEEISKNENPVVLPSYDQILESKKKYGESFMLQYQNTDAITGKILLEPYRDTFVVVNPPQKPLTQKELDRIYALPFERDYHPATKKLAVFLLSERLSTA